MKMLKRTLIIALLAVCVFGVAARVQSQEPADSAQIQRQIEGQQRRLDSVEVEERRDALMRLGTLKRPEASRVAAKCLSDPVPIIRIAAAHAVVYLPSDEAAGLLIPLLRDHDEFVRQEIAYALGEANSRTAVKPLADVLLGDKMASVRGAAAISLGRLADEAAVVALSQVLADVTAKKKGADVFAGRAAARSLGQIRSKAGLPALLAALVNEQNDIDVRREAAVALGLIGDISATSALQAAASSKDPYLAQAANVSLHSLAGIKD